VITSIFVSNKPQLNRQLAGAVWGKQCCLACSRRKGYGREGEELNGKRSRSTFVEYLSGSARRRARQGVAKESHAAHSSTGQPNESARWWSGELSAQR
jgi:hypothetical protein